MAAQKMQLRTPRARSGNRAETEPGLEDGFPTASGAGRPEALFLQRKPEKESVMGYCP